MWAQETATLDKAKQVFEKDPSFANAEILVSEFSSAKQLDEGQSFFKDWLASAARSESQEAAVLFAQGFLYSKAYDWAGAQKVLDRAERMKARGFLESLGEAQERRGGVSPVLIRQKRTLESRMRWLEGNISP